MYCKNCGKTITKAAAFCKECGAPVPQKEIENDTYETQVEKPEYTQVKNEPSSSGEHEVENDEPNIESQTEILKRNKVFHSSDEILIDTLGSGFLSTVLVNNEFGKSVMICTNKRVYQRGKLIFRDFRRRINYSKGKAYVDLKDITGVYYEVTKPVFLWITVFFLWLLVSLIIAFAIAFQDTSEDLYAIGIFIFSLSLIAILLYHLKKVKWLTIQHAGGEISTNCNWYSTKSISRFMKNVSIQKDIITNYKANR